MDEFLANIAGMLELFAVAAGLVLLHMGSKEPPALLLRAAGLFTGWYWFKYQAAGDFDRAAKHSQLEPSALPGLHRMPSGGAMRPRAVNIRVACVAKEARARMGQVIHAMSSEEVT